MKKYIHLKKSRNKKWYNIAMMTKAMTLVENGFVKEGIETADRLICEIRLNFSFMGNKFVN